MQYLVNIRKTMAPSEEKLTSIKSEIRSLLVSSTSGLSLGGFLKDYKECLGNHLPFREFGYPSAWDFLASMPDVVQVKETNDGKLLMPVNNKLTSHIQKLVTEQRKANRRPRKSRKSTYVNFNRSYFTIERKTKYPKTSKIDNFFSDDDSFISDLDELFIARSNQNSASNVQKCDYKNKKYPSKNIIPEKRQQIVSNNSLVSTSSPLKLESNVLKRMAKKPTTEIEQWHKLNGNLPLDSEEETCSSPDEIRVYCQMEQTKCYKYSEDADTSELSDSFSEFRHRHIYKQPNYKIVASEEEECSTVQLSSESEQSSYNQPSYHHLLNNGENLDSTDTIDFYHNSYPFSKVSEKNISTHQRHFTSCGLLTENGEPEHDLSYAGASKVQNVSTLYISSDHNNFLSALINGIILDPDKILEPYAMNLTKKIQDNHSSNSFLLETGTTLQDEDAVTQTSDETIDLYEISSAGNFDEASKSRTLNTSEILSEFRRMISLRNKQSENNKSSISKQTTAGSCEKSNALLRNVGRGSVLKTLYDAYQLRRNTKAERHHNSSPVQVINSREQFLKQLIERREFQ